MTLSDSRSRAILTCTSASLGCSRARDAFKTLRPSPQKTTCSPAPIFSHCAPAEGFKLVSEFRETQKLSTTTARKAKIELWVPKSTVDFESYENTGKVISTIAFPGSAQNLGAAVVADTSVLPGISFFFFVFFFLGGVGGILQDFSRPTG